MLNSATSLLCSCSSLLRIFFNSPRTSSVVTFSLDAKCVYGVGPVNLSSNLTSTGPGLVVIFCFSFVSSPCSISFGIDSSPLVVKFTLKFLKELQYVDVIIY